MEKRKCSVFIIDDDRFLVEMYVLKCGEKNMSADFAYGSKEALEKIQGGLSPDIVLLDILMPVMNGFELLQKIRSENLLPHATVIILSNLGQKEDVERGLKLGADGYIVKINTTPNEVVEKIREVLREKQATKS